MRNVVSGGAAIPMSGMSSGLTIPFELPVFNKHLAYDAGHHVLLCL